MSACDRLQSAGIAQYEISNFARTGFESRHNLKYWTRQPYLGFGVDAHSMLRAVDREGHEFTRASKTQAREPRFSPCGVEAVRFAAPDSLEQHVAHGPLQPTLVSRRAALEESFFLGLRLNRGISLRELTAKFGGEAIENVRIAIEDLVEDGLMEQREQYLCLTPRGRLLSNEVFERFILNEVAS